MNDPNQPTLWDDDRWTQVHDYVYDGDDDE